MIGKIYKVTMGYFDPNPAYWAYNGRYRREIVILAVRWSFLVVLKKSENHIFVESGDIAIDAPPEIWSLKKSCKGI